MKIKRIIGGILVAAPFAIIFAGQVQKNGLQSAAIELAVVVAMMVAMFFGLQMLNK